MALVRTPRDPLSTTVLQSSPSFAEAVQPAARPSSTVLQSNRKYAAADQPAAHSQTTVLQSSPSCAEPDQGAARLPTAACNRATNLLGLISRLQAVLAWLLPPEYDGH